MSSGSSVRLRNARRSPGQERRRTGNWHAVRCRRRQYPRGSGDTAGTRPVATYVAKRRDPTVIRLERLHKAYGACTAVEPLTLEVAPGEVVALVGPNGAGKSTTLRALAGLIRPTSGHASIGGYDVVTEATAARSRLGYLPQRSGTPSATVLADLAALVAGIREIPFTHAIDVLAAAAWRSVSTAPWVNCQAASDSGRWLRWPPWVPSPPSCWTSPASAWTPKDHTMSARRSAGLEAAGRLSCLLHTICRTSPCWPIASL